MPFSRWAPLWKQTLYTSATNLSTNANSGILALPTFPDGTSVCLFGHSFSILGNGITTDETLALTLDFYASSGGAEGSVGTMTFDTLTASVLTDTEHWPGDLHTAASTVIMGMIPVPPYFQASWTLAGTTKSMGFTLYGNFYYLTGA